MSNVSQPAKSDAEIQRAALVADDGFAPGFAG